MSQPILSAANSLTSDETNFVVAGNRTTDESLGDAFVDRRGAAQSNRRRPASKNDERRQFGSSHAGLTEDGRELAIAIDQYKLRNHRRYITCDEMLSVIRDLGYSRGATSSGMS